ncbi:MAG: DUF433 domain-containing protein [Candidatus Poribacteria bacterium]|nr:DUF433 domain-containing protein [Candidatus Poribacteria bacterium]
MINQDPDIHSGEPVFMGTRVPIKSLIDHLKAGESLDDFLDGFTSVSREQAIAFLEFALETVFETVNTIKSEDNPTCVFYLTKT